MNRIVIALHLSLPILISLYYWLHSEWLGITAIIVVFVLTVGNLSATFISDDDQFRKLHVANLYILLIHSVVLAFVAWPICFSMYTISLILMAARKVRADGKKTH